MESITRDEIVQTSKLIVHAWARALPMYPGAENIRELHNALGNYLSAAAILNTSVLQIRDGLDGFFKQKAEEAGPYKP